MGNFPIKTKSFGVKTLRPLKSAKILWVFPVRFLLFWSQIIFSIFVVLLSTTSKCHCLSLAKNYVTVIVLRHIILRRQITKKHLRSKHPIIECVLSSKHVSIAMPSTCALTQVSNRYLVFDPEYWVVDLKIVMEHRPAMPNEGFSTYVWYSVAAFKKSDGWQWPYVSLSGGCEFFHERRQYFT